jgi:ABC-type glutathione transport system ATPase component
MHALIPLSRSAQVAGDRSGRSPDERAIGARHPSADWCVDRNRLDRLRNTQGGLIRRSTSGHAVGKTGRLTVAEDGQRLVADPALVLLDEPFGSLDAITRLRMHDLVRGLRRRHNATMLLVTHDVDGAIALADRSVSSAAPRRPRGGSPAVEGIRVATAR